MQSSSQIITTNKPTPNFLRARWPFCRPTNSVKALKGKCKWKLYTQIAFSAFTTVVSTSWPGLGNHGSQVKEKPSMYVYVWTGTAQLISTRVCYRDNSSWEEDTGIRLVWLEEYADCRCLIYTTDTERRKQFHNFIILMVSIRIRMVKVFVWSVVLYGSETWTLQKEDIRWLEALEIWIWRCVMKVSWTEHNKWRYIADGWDRKRNKGHSLKSTEEMDRSHLETWFIIENNLRRTNPKEEGLWRTKNNVFRLVTADGGNYYWIWRTKDVGMVWYSRI